MNAFRNDPDGVFVKWARGMASGLKKPVLEIKRLSFGRRRQMWRHCGSVR